MADALGWAPGGAVVSNYGTGGDPHARGERLVIEPAATVTGKIDRNRLVMVNGPQSNAAVRCLDEPSGTVYSSRSGNLRWSLDRPSTTVLGDPRISTPGTRDRASGEPQFGPDTARVSVEEAAALQTFPIGFPWRGGKSARYQQVGNAVPPLLGRAVLGQVAP